MKINILTLFPNFFASPLQESILKRAQDNDKVEFQIVNIRDFAQDKHHTTDLPPYGGGAGMVMKVEPIDLALQSLGVEKGQQDSLIVLTSAKGQVFTQQKSREWQKLKFLTIVCGHYEGVDQRVADHLVDTEIRIGDYVLTGGEPAALVMLDAVTRLVPGVVGNDESLEQESHDQPGFLAHPQYTRPKKYKDWQVPEVLLSGNHEKIKAWRKNYHD